jgi:hypothetical protein
MTKQPFMSPCEHEANPDMFQIDSDFITHPVSYPVGSMGSFSKC